LRGKNKGFREENAAVFGLFLGLFWGCFWGCFGCRKREERERVFGTLDEERERGFIK